jgi:hypothetical protein
VVWGFQTQNLDKLQGRGEAMSQVHDWFKVFFDEAEYNRARAKNPQDVPKSHADVKRYYLDFLRKLCQTVKERLIDNVPDWRTAHIEFLFSVPTTWTKLGLTNDFKELAKAAGFGRDGPNHVVDVSLTEAEAAAVHTFTAQNAVYNVT